MRSTTTLLLSVVSLASCSAASMTVVTRGPTVSGVADVETRSVRLQLQEPAMPVDVVTAPRLRAEVRQVDVDTLRVSWGGQSLELDIGGDRAELRHFDGAGARAVLLEEATVGPPRPRTYRAGTPTVWLEVSIARDGVVVTQRDAQVSSAGVLHRLEEAARWEPRLTPR